MDLKRLTSSGYAVEPEQMGLTIQWIKPRHETVGLK